MTMSWQTGFTVLSIVVIVLAMLASPVRAEELGDGYLTLLTDMGQELLQTGRVLHVGDRFINEDNRMYEVHEVRERQAYARYIGRVDLSRAVEQLEFLELTSAQDLMVSRVSEADSVDVGIYHTHSAESYIPTSGTDSKEGDGDVLAVGETLAEELENTHLRVEHDPTVHDPHDAAAYVRSRRTAVQLLQRDPQALFDVHRDTGPREGYTAEIYGEDVARILLVVGRGNPNMNANLSFAKSLKAAADEEYPGLVKGILLGRGDYNQDLGPRVLLLEVGSVKNSLEEAERGVSRLASVVPAVVPGGGEEETGPSALWLLLLVLLGGALFLVISSGSWEEARARLGQYIPWDTGGRAR